MQEKESCVFCGSSDLVKSIGGNKGICSTCAEKLTDVLISTRRGRKEFGSSIGPEIARQIEDHKSKDHVKS